MKTSKATMKILVLNPNTTGSMTAKIAGCARDFASDGVEIIARNPSCGPVSIEGYFDQAQAAAGIIDEVRRAVGEGVDGIVLACFDDPSLDACRALATCPVIGICEAAVHTATMLGTSFSVVTTLPRSVPIIQDLVLKYGAERRCRRVRASGIPVLDLETSADARQRVLEHILSAKREDGCESIVLGCAGMADLARWLSEESGLPVIDGVVAGVKIMEALIGTGLKTSKVGAYATPRQK